MGVPYFQLQSGKRWLFPWLAQSNSPVIEKRPIPAVARGQETAASS
jgi:hypothetical protein